jgi:guanine nucleotide-binding protein subunit alpha
MPVARSILSSLHEDFDPLANAIKPPTNESEEDKAVRLGKEKHEKEISDAIDRDIEATKQASRKGPKPTNILLLGEQ